MKIKKSLKLTKFIKNIYIFWISTFVFQNIHKNKIKNIKLQQQENYYTIKLLYEALIIIMGGGIQLVLPL